MRMDIFEGLTQDAKRKDDVEALEEDYDIVVFKLMPGTCEAW